ncbi:hypothetical protein U0E10_31305 [Burkholderia ubonensis]|uniref:hypothetical protein n=1 Tax=Burkholderia ubonensis TaxID=101571 RepID=UPI002AB5CD33|nr:hypothetical protein [Burkholderia ubonensis]MDY7792389.1 hypothetical protein [Burkholderia ubonensis]
MNAVAARIEAANESIQEWRVRRAKARPGGMSKVFGASDECASRRTLTTWLKRGAPHDEVCGLRGECRCTDGDCMQADAITLNRGCRFFNEAGKRRIDSVELLWVFA